jgi:hypothetical protein
MVKVKLLIWWFVVALLLETWLCSEFCQAFGADVWIVDNVDVYADGGIVTIRIDAPNVGMSRKEAGNVADKNWYRRQLDAISVSKEREYTVTIPLTRKDSRLRLGGGFVHIQADSIVIPQRDATAPTRPLVFTECSGVFDIDRRDYLEAMLIESAEIVRFSEDGVLYIPRLSGEMARYNQAIEEETVAAARLARIPFASTMPIGVEVVALINYATLHFASVTPIKLGFAAEIDTSSLEFIGLLRYPDLPNVRFQDTEGFFKSDGQFQYLQRETHVINYKTGEDSVWQNGKITRNSTVETEIDKIDLGKSGGIFATEKLQTAIRGLPFDAPGLKLFLEEVRR